MWILLAIAMMALALKAFSLSFTLALIRFAAGCWCFGKSNRDDLDTFMAFAFILVVIGFVINVVAANW